MQWFNCMLQCRPLIFTHDSRNPLLNLVFAHVDNHQYHTAGMNNSFSTARIFATVPMALIGSRRFTHMKRMTIDVKGKHILIHYATHARPQNSYVMLLFMNAI